MTAAFQEDFMRIPDTRPTLIARLHQAEDSSAWMEFCEIYEPTTYRIARKYGLQDADAREVSQNVLLAVSRKIARFDLAKDGRFRSWLAQIARNAAIDQLRKRVKCGVGGSDFMQRLAEVPGQPKNDEEQFELEARRQQFLWAAEQVRQQANGTAWHAFWLSAVEGLSGEAVAKRLGMSVGAVYVARCRTLAKIKNLLAPYREENK
jgi:RNA polymerase sigma-70 factor, ECF subfamily